MDENVKKQMKAELAGRAPDQQAIIRYFYQAGGCGTTLLTDEQYDNYIKQIATGTNFYQLALDKHGLDESQIKEVEPINFADYLYDGNSYALRGKDGRWRSSAFQITWIFFSSTQVYVYKFTFNTSNDEKKEETADYFYKDVTNFTTTSDTLEMMVPGATGCTGETTYVRTTVNSNRFMLSSMGDKLYCAMAQNDYTTRSITAMKAKLREKKGD